MTSSDFTLERLCKSFGLTLHRAPLFPQAAAVAVPAWLNAWLARTLPFALGSEKARSTFLIAPLLVASVEAAPPPLAISSGQRLLFRPAPRCCPRTAAGDGWCPALQRARGNPYPGADGL